MVQVAQQSLPQISRAPHPNDPSLLLGGKDPLLQARHGHSSHYYPEVPLRRDCIGPLARLHCLYSCRQFPYRVLCDLDLVYECVHRIQSDPGHAWLHMQAKLLSHILGRKGLANIKASLPWTRPVRLCKSDQDFTKMAHSQLCAHKISCKGSGAFLYCWCTSDGSRRAPGPGVCSDTPGCDTRYYLITCTCASAHGDHQELCDAQRYATGGRRKALLLHRLQQLLPPNVCSDPIRTDY